LQFRKFLELIFIISINSLKVYTFIMKTQSDPIGCSNICNHPRLHSRVMPLIDLFLSNINLFQTDQIKQSVVRFHLKSYAVRTLFAEFVFYTLRQVFLLTPIDTITYNNFKYPECSPVITDVQMNYNINFYFQITKFYLPNNYIYKLKTILI
jgi:hypothetical protein